MKKGNSKPLIVAGMLSMMLSIANEEVQASSTFYSKSFQENTHALPRHPKKDGFKYGQYVYVKLKRKGEETVAKIDGRKSANKYFVDEVHGIRYGAVHKKFIRPLSQEEVAKLKEVGADQMKHLGE